MNLVPIDGRNPAQIVYYALPEANMAPETIVSKRKVVFQPSISFSGAILVSGRVSQVKHVRQIASFTQERIRGNKCQIFETTNRDGEFYPTIIAVVI